MVFDPVQLKMLTRRAIHVVIFGARDDQRNLTRGLLKKRRRRAVPDGHAEPAPIVAVHP